MLRPFFAHGPGEPKKQSPDRHDLLVEANRWQTLLDSTDQAILVSDSQGTVKIANEAAEQLFGELQPSAGLAKSDNTITTLLSFTVSSGLDSMLRQSVASHETIDSEISTLHHIPRSLQVRIVPVSDDEFLILLHDLTELKRLERVRQDFVANVSHELRTPLTSVRAMAETLLDGALEDRAVSSRFLETIIREADRLVRLSSDLLELSRAEACDVRHTVVDLTVVIHDVAQRLSDKAQQNLITISNKLTRPLYVLADYDDLAQVAINLLDNAISYTPHNGQVSVHAQESSTSVTVSVEDTGIGIAAHDIPRIFERFYRADKARSRASGGTGLGLSIVKHIVESHGGHVSVTSEYNKGSVFKFTLPKSPLQAGL